VHRMVEDALARGVAFAHRPDIINERSC
jgi:hypothetical protein